jgi:hypothetical protein
VKRLLTILEMNIDFEEVTEDLSNGSFLDVQEFTTPPDGILDALLHFRRPLHLRMVEELRELVEVNTSFKRKSNKTVRSPMKSLSDSTTMLLPPNAWSAFGVLKNSSELVTNTVDAMRMDAKVAGSHSRAPQ